MTPNLLGIVTGSFLLFFVAAGPGWTGAVPDNDPPARQRAMDVDQPAGWDEDLALAEVEDLDPDPDVIELHLEARVAEVEILPGTTTELWTYEGSLPGPLIRAKVGDAVVVHFRNSLPEATTVHWHGVHLSNEMDGVPGVTQDPVEPGGTFTYEFTLDDAGTFWYHPHVSSSHQIARGLYGAILVTDPNDPEEFGDDLVLVLSDISLDPDGRLRPTDSGGSFGDLFGREGNMVLVNGRLRPTLKVRAGKQQRWRVINAARTRYFPVAVWDHQLVKLGGGQGLAERSESLYRLILVPGERADLVFTPSGDPGTALTWLWMPVNRGDGTWQGRYPKDLLRIETVEAEPVTPEPIPEELGAVARADIEGAIERTVELTVSIKGERVEMGINGIAHHPDVEPIEARVGETQVWTVVNDSDFAHPFHVHGYAFQVLDEDRPTEWKDTIDIPAKTTRRVAIRFDDRPGTWMFHCHILDHAEVGMMGRLHVMR